MGKMTSFDERLRDPLYLFYLKIGMCLAILKEGLEHFSEFGSRKLHLNIFHFANFKNNPSAESGLCRNAKIKYIPDTWDCSCCIGCSKLIKEIAERCNETYHLKRLNWNNSDLTGWVGKHGHWQIAKLFMNKGLKPSQNRPEDTDICGILNFMRNCRVVSHFMTNVDHIEKVIKIRNTVMHSPQMKMTEREFMESSKIMIEFLEHLLEGNWPVKEDFEVTILRLQKVRTSKFCMRYTDELEVMEQRLSELDRMAVDLKHQVSDLKKRNKDSMSRSEELLSELEKVTSKTKLQERRNCKSCKTKHDETARQATDVREILRSFKELISEDQTLHIRFKHHISELETTVTNVREAVKQSLDTGYCTQKEHGQCLGNMQANETLPCTLYQETGLESHSSEVFVQGQESEKLIPNHQRDEIRLESQSSEVFVQGQESEKLIPNHQWDEIRLESHNSEVFVQGQESDKLLPNHQRAEIIAEPQSSGEFIHIECDEEISDHQGDETRERNCCCRLLNALWKLATRSGRRRRYSGERNCCCSVLDALWEFAIHSCGKRRISGGGLDVGTMTNWIRDGDGRVLCNQEHRVSDGGTMTDWNADADKRDLCAQEVVPHQELPIGCQRSQQFCTNSITTDEINYFDK